MTRSAAAALRIALDPSKKILRSVKKRFSLLKSGAHHIPAIRWGGARSPHLSSKAAGEQPEQKPSYLQSILTEEEGVAYQLVVIGDASRSLFRHTACPAHAACPATLDGI